VERTGVKEERMGAAEQTNQGQGKVRAAEPESSRVCPRCGQTMREHQCKLVCARCGYFLSCSDF